ncbi:MAG: PIN domain-containing protein [Caulobacteraceae bacterium]
MSGRAFFDTNILIYALCAVEAKTVEAERLLNRGGVVGVQVLNEFVAVARRKFAMGWEDVADALGAIHSFCGDPTPLDGRVHVIGVDLARAHGLQIYDALVVSAALMAKCDTLYTEDMQHGRVFEGRLRLEHPFAVH